MTRRQALVLLAMLLIIGPARPALACSCMPHPVDTAQAVAAAWPQADAIFLGKVTAIKSGAPGLSRWRTVVFEVDRSWKGTPDNLALEVRTASNSAACGYPFDSGQTYVVFAFRQPGSGQLTTNLCALNKRKENAADVTRELDRLKRMESGAR